MLLGLKVCSFFFFGDIVYRKSGEEREREEDSGMGITGSIYLRSMLWGFFQRKGARVMNLH